MGYIYRYAHCCLRCYFVCAQDKRTDTGITQNHPYIVLRFCLQIYLGNFHKKCVNLLLQSNTRIQKHQECDFVIIIMNEINISLSKVN